LERLKEDAELREENDLVEAVLADVSVVRDEAESDDLVEGRLLEDEADVDGVE